MLSAARALIQEMSTKGYALSVLVLLLQDRGDTHLVSGTFCRRKAALSALMAPRIGADSLESLGAGQAAAQQRHLLACKTHLGVMFD